MRTYVIKWGRVFVGNYELGEQCTQQSVGYRWIDEKIKPMEFNDKATAQEIADRLNDVFARHSKKKHKVMLKKTALENPVFCLKKIGVSK